MSGSTTTDVTRKRKRVKLKCLVCGRAFDDDHRKDHNEKFHPEYKRENRLVPFETLGVAIDDYAKDGGEELFTKMHCVLITNS